MENATKMLIEVVIAWSAIITVLVTIIMGMMAFNFFTQTARSKEILTKMETQVKEIVERYNLAQLRTPDEILLDAQKEYEPLIEQLRKLTEAFGQDSEKNVQSLREEILKQIDDVRNYYSHELQGSLFTRICNAFQEVRSLSSDERAAIAKVLNTGGSTLQ